MVEPFLYCPKADCIDIWTVVEKWTGIPTEELNKLVNDGTLQLYKKDVPPHGMKPVSDDVFYLEPYYGPKVKFGESLEGGGFFQRDTWVKALVADGRIGGKQPVLDTVLRMPKRYFFLLANVAQLEKEYPNFLAPTPTPTLSPAEQENEGLQAEIGELKATVAQQSAENATLRDDSALAKQENEGLQAEIGELKATVAQQSAENAALRNDSTLAEQKKKAMKAQIAELEAIIELRDIENATLRNGAAIVEQEKKAIMANIKALEARLAQKADEIAAQCKADAWRSDWGFVDYIIGLIEASKSKMEVANILIARKVPMPVVKAITSDDTAQEASQKQYSRAVIGAITSEDKANVTLNALRIRADGVLKGKKK